VYCSQSGSCIWLLCSRFSGAGGSTGTNLSSPSPVSGMKFFSCSFPFLNLKVHVTGDQKERLVQLWQLLLTWPPQWRRNNFWPTERISSSLFLSPVWSWRRTTAKIIERCQSFHCSEGYSIQYHCAQWWRHRSCSPALLPDSHDLFFHPEPKKTQKRSESGTREKLGQHLQRHLHGMTQHYVSMGLESLASSKQAVCSVNRQRYSIPIKPPHRMW